MKKLMIIGTVALIGLVSKAASVEWMAEGIEALATQAAIDDTKVYAFESATMTQDAFLALYVAADNTWLTSATLAEAFEDGAAMGTVSGYANGAQTSTWLAIFDTDGNVLISEAETDAIGGAGQSAYPYFDLSDASAVGMLDAAEGFAGAGWYTASEPVPEPTSGLLLLLGMAGLALKRKQA